MLVKTTLLGERIAVASETGVARRHRQRRCAAHLDAIPDSVPILLLLLADPVQ